MKDYVIINKSEQLHPRSRCAEGMLEANIITQWSEQLLLRNGRVEGIIETNIIAHKPNRLLEVELLLHSGCAWRESRKPTSLDPLLKSEQLLQPLPHSGCVRRVQEGSKQANIIRSKPEQFQPRTGCA